MHYILKSQKEGVVEILEKEMVIDPLSSSDMRLRILRNERNVINEMVRIFINDEEGLISDSIQLNIKYGKDWECE